MRTHLSALAVCGLLAGASAATAQSTTNYTYDDLGRLKTTTPATGQPSTYTYDNAGNRTAVQTGTTGGGGTNHAPTCNSVVRYPSSPPSSVNPATYTVQANILINQCSDQDGDTLTVISPGTPVTVTAYSGQPTYFTFTVSDGHGGTASADYTISRP